MLDLTQMDKALKDFKTMQMQADNKLAELQKEELEKLDKAFVVFSEDLDQLRRIKVDTIPTKNLSFVLNVEDEHKHFLTIEFDKDEYASANYSGKNYYIYNEYDLSSLQNLAFVLINWNTLKVKVVNKFQEKLQQELEWELSLYKEKLEKTQNNLKSLDK